VCSLRFLQRLEEYLLSYLEERVWWWFATIQWWSFAGTDVSAIQLVLH
jgi:hypothetical protein